MKKITTKLLLLVAVAFTSFSANAQFGCDSAVPVTAGFTSMGITTPGNEGPEDWNTNPASALINSLYWDDDAYAFTYTAGATAELIEMTIFTRKTWNGIGIFTTCSGTVFSGNLDAAGSGTSGNIEQSVSALIDPGQTVYIIVGQWGTPNGLDFDVVSFDVQPMADAPECATVTSPVDEAENVSVDGVFTWTTIPSATGYYVNLGTTPGGSEVLDMEDVGTAGTFNVPGSLAGNTMHYLTVIPYNSNGPADDCTEISFTTATPPANDECTGAIELTVNDGPTCTEVTSATNLDASQSMAASPCYGNPNDDVWFTFTANSSTHIITLSNRVAISGTSIDLYFQVLSGDCDGLTSLLCSDPETNQVTGLTVGNTYYVRVYSYYATSSQTFDICVSTPAPPPPAPANDECENAVTLTVNPDFSCAVVTSATTVSATESMAAGECGGNPNDDVWFSFEATSASHRISITNRVAVSGSSIDMYMQVLSGSCGTLTSVACSDPETANLTGLTVGEIYFVRVYSYFATSSQTFDICVGTPPPPPANDDFANAIAVECDGTYSGNTTLATLDENDAPDGFGADMDAPNVWYSFTGTAGTAQTVTLTLCESSYDTSVLVYTGTSGNLTLVAGNDDDATCGTGATSRSRVSFNSDGISTYFIAIEGYNSGSVGEYIMDVTCADAVPPTEENQACASSVEVFVDGVSITSDNTNGTVNPTQPSCDNFGTIQDVWFMFTAPESGEVDVVVTLDSMTSGNFNVYSGTCDELVPVANSCNSNFSTSATEAMSGLTAGEIYYIQVWSGAAEEGTFSVVLNDPTLSVGGFKKSAFKYYPNPVNDILQISHTSTLSEVTVFNIMGQQLMSQKVGLTETTVDMSALPAGTYMVKATAGDVTSTFKIIKN